MRPLGNFLNFEKGEVLFISEMPWLKFPFQNWYTMAGDHLASPSPNYSPFPLSTSWVELVWSTTTDSSPGQQAWGGGSMYSAPTSESLGRPFPSIPSPVQPSIPPPPSLFPCLLFEQPVAPRWGRQNGHPKHSSDRVTAWAAPSSRFPEPWGCRPRSTA